MVYISLQQNILIVVKKYDFFYEWISDIMKWLFSGQHLLIALFEPHFRFIDLFINSPAIDNPCCRRLVKAIR